MLDLKAVQSTLSQLEEERGIPREAVIEAIEFALAAAYKKDYGKKGQIVRAEFNMESGKTEFFQVKIAVDESMLKPEEEEDEEEVVNDTPVIERGKKIDSTTSDTEEGEDEEDHLIKFNPEHHIMIDDAQKIKRNVQPSDELVFPLESKDDYGRIAAQTAKQVIIQRIREAEKIGVLHEFGEKQGDIVNGTVQRIERGNVFVDLGKAIGIMPYDEQIRGERFKQGERVRAFLYLVEETPRGINLKLSRSHPKFIEKLFEVEAPEIAGGVVEIKSIAREAGSRSKIAVLSHDEHVDPVGSCVGQRGVRVTTVMSELGGEKIDIIEWSEDSAQFIEDALSPAKIRDIEIFEEEKRSEVSVQEDQLSLAIGRGGQNVRLAAKLTGWHIDIKSVDGEMLVEDGEIVEDEEVEKETVPEEITDEGNDSETTDTDTVATKEDNELADDEEPENTPEEAEEAVAEVEESETEAEENSESDSDTPENDETTKSEKTK